MSVIMVGADYIGKAIKSAQHQNNIPAKRLAHLFGCDLEQLHRYEEGTDLISRDSMRRVFLYAAMMDAALNKE